MEAWYRTSCPECGGEGRRETDVSDTFLDSSWYFLRYPSTDREDIAMDPEITRRWLPVDCYIGGEEHAVLHLLYARFVTMALRDMGLLDFDEPFSKFRKHGLIIREGAKMSKSKGNVVIPDPIIEEFGADTFRTYLMFLGPFSEGGDYRDEGIQGPFGFLHRLFDTVIAAAGVEGEEAFPDPAVERKLHQTIRKVSEQVPNLQYNTAIAAMMEYLNAVRTGGRQAARAEVEPLVLLVAPFAPHLAEELWERLGHSGSIFESGGWPSFDPDKAAEETVQIAVQVNGKLRGTVEVPAGTGQEEVEALARAEENVDRHLAGRHGSTRHLRAGSLHELRRGITTQTGVRTRTGAAPQSWRHTECPCRIPSASRLTETNTSWTPSVSSPWTRSRRPIPDTREPPWAWRPWDTRSGRGISGTTRWTPAGRTGTDSSCRWAMGPCSSIPSSTSPGTT